MEIELLTNRMLDERKSQVSWFSSPSEHGLEPVPPMANGSQLLISLPCTGNLHTSRGGGTLRRDPASPNPKMSEMYPCITRLSPYKLFNLRP